MAESIGGFVKVSTPEGSSLYINPHHVTAIEAGSKCVIRICDGSTIIVAEELEELVQMLDPRMLGGRPRPRHAAGLRHRIRRRGS